MVVRMVNPYQDVQEEYRRMTYELSKKHALPQKKREYFFRGILFVENDDGTKSDNSWLSRIPGVRYYNDTLDLFVSDFPKYACGPALATAIASVRDNYVNFKVRSFVFCEDENGVRLVLYTIADGKNVAFVFKVILTDDMPKKLEHISCVLEDQGVWREENGVLVVLSEKGSYAVEYNRTTGLLKLIFNELITLSDIR